MSLSVTSTVVTRASPFPRLGCAAVFTPSLQDPVSPVKDKITVCELATSRDAFALRHRTYAALGYDVPSSGMRSHSCLGAVAIALALAASTGSAQDALDTKTKPLPGPSRRELLFGATAGSATLALGGVTTAYIAYTLVCQHRHRNSEESSGFGPCFPPSDESLALGWYGGSFAGAAGVAATVAVRRGCPVREAAWRSMAGAAVGTLPGLLAMTIRPDRIPARRGRLIAITPVLSGIGAAVAVVGCEHR